MSLRKHNFRSFAHFGFYSLERGHEGLIQVGTAHESAIPLRNEGAIISSGTDDGDLVHQSGELGLSGDLPF